MDFLQLPLFQRHSSQVDFESRVFPLGKNVSVTGSWGVCGGRSLTDLFTLPEVLGVFTVVHERGSLALREL